MKGPGFKPDRPNWNFQGVAGASPRLGVSVRRKPAQSDAIEIMLRRLVRRQAGALIRIRRRITRCPTFPQSPGIAASRTQTLQSVESLLRYRLAGPAACPPSARSPPRLCNVRLTSRSGNSQFSWRRSASRKEQSLARWLGELVKPTQSGSSQFSSRRSGSR